MLTVLEVRSLYEGDPTGGTAFTTLTIPITAPADDQPLFVRDITGLGPAPASINTQNFASLDGDFFNGKRVQRRNIVAKLGLNPMGGPQSVDAIRRMCYAYGLVSGGFVGLRFHFDDDRPTLEALGYVESAEPNRFAKDPEMVVSVICPNPSFVSIVERTITGTMNPSAGTPTEFDMNGNKTVPFLMTIDFAGNPLSTEDLWIDFGTPMSLAKFFRLQTANIPGGTFELNTAKGNKYVRFFGSISLLKYMTSDSLWPYLVPGGNAVRVRTPSHTSLHMEWTMKFREEFSAI